MFGYENNAASQSSLFEMDKVFLSLLSVHAWEVTRTRPYSQQASCPAGGARETSEKQESCGVGKADG